MRSVQSEYCLFNASDVFIIKDNAFDSNCVTWWNL